MNIEQVKETAAFLMSKIRVIPKIAVVLGTGLSDFANLLEDRVEIPYCNIPGFSKSTVTGHPGRFVFGKLEDKYIVAMQGRVHCYEGYTMGEITFPVWVLKAMGVENLILTNAAGAINRDYEPGDLVIIKDHIKLCLESPLMGIGDNEFGNRFHDMTNAYSRELIEMAKDVAYGKGVNVNEGVYAFMGGPQFETSAEVKMLEILGADLVGMSTVPEVIVATHLGMKILAMSCVTNYAAGISDTPISHEDVKMIGDSIKESFEYIMSGIIGRIKTE